MSEEYKNEYEKLWEEWLPRLKNYSNNRIDLVKLSLVEAVAKAAASVTSNLILFFTFLHFCLCKFRLGTVYWQKNGRLLLGFWNYCRILFAVVLADTDVA